MAGYTNFEMDGMRDSLAPLLERRDLCGYAAARNYRTLCDELAEYDKRKEEVITSIGEQEMDGDAPTGRWRIPPERVAQYVEEMGPYGTVAHEPSIMRVKYEDVIGKLSGSEMIAVEWMLEE
jgi:hypothetical protein